MKVLPPTVDMMLVGIESRSMPFQLMSMICGVQLLVPKTIVDPVPMS
jgi:hypothetical protein